MIKDLPNISILLPTLGRPESLKRCLDSIAKLEYPKELIEVLCEEDEPRMGVPKRVEKLRSQATSDIYIFAANDIEFSPDSIRIAVEELKTHGLVAFNDGPVLPDEGNICCHFMIRKDLVEQLENKEIFSTEFWHCGVDNWLWAQAKKLGQAYRSEEAKINHYHFSRGTAEFDAVNELGWKQEERLRDQELLKNKLASLYA